MKRMDPWAVLAWIAVAAALLLVLTGEAMDPVPAAQPSATEEPYGCGVPLAGAAQPSATEEPYGCGVPLAGNAPTARERAAQFAAQEEYYRVVDFYGDPEGAAQAAELTYKNFENFEEEN